MIQVCAQCGTRWNVRDRQRVWCPKCNGTLLAPSAPAPDPQWSARHGAAPLRPGAQGMRSRPPAGYRWIAVRPGQPPNTRRPRRPLGPTPHYTVVPRWGLVEYFDLAEEQHAPPRGGPSPAMLRATLITTIVVLGAAAAIHAVRYVLLLINRSVLLHPLIAGVATWLGVAISVLAMFTVVASAIVLTNWLIARRAAAFAHLGQDDPRPVWALRAGCLVPLVNLAWAPVFTMDLARVEDKLGTQRKPIVVWWLVWVVSTVISVLSFATSFTTDPQGIANNTVTTTVAYLLALAALVLVAQVVLGFERSPVERPARRYVMVAGEPAPEPAPIRGADESPADGAAGLEKPLPVEARGQDPAA